MRGEDTLPLLYGSKKDISWETLHPIWFSQLIFVLPLKMFFFNAHTFALPETSSFPSCNLFSVQSDIIDVYTRHSSLKVSSITNLCSHSYWIISRKLYPANSSRRNDSAVQVEFGFPSVIVVSSCNVLPFIRFNTLRSKSWS